MALLHVILVYTGVQCVLVLTTPVQRLCPSGQYLDEATGACTFCSVICDQAELQGTVDVCRQLCPDYQSREISQEERDLCPPDTYLDKTLRCEACGDICDEGHKHDTCEKFCPGYLERQPRMDMSLLLWCVVATLCVVLFALITGIVVKIVSVKCQNTSHRSISRTAPFVVPYLKLDEEKPQQRVNQWLTLLHSTEAETDSCYGSKLSLIYTPPKSKC